MVDERRAEVDALTDRSRRTLGHLLDRADAELAHTLARVVALSPAATLRRGYAVLQRADGSVVRVGEARWRRRQRSRARRGRRRVRCHGVRGRPEPGGETGGGPGRAGAAGGLGRRRRLSVADA